MRVGIVGTGKVGSSLGQYLVNNEIEIAGVYDILSANSKQMANVLNTEYFSELSFLVAASDILFLTVTDSAIADVWEQIREFDINGKIICHCSGALASTVFINIENLGASGYSVHPVMVISNTCDYEALAQAPFTIEGDENRISALIDLFGKLGNQVQIITAQNKIKYHAAAVFSSNFVNVLASISGRLLSECGLGEKEQQLFTPLLKQAAHNVNLVGPINSLTGPIERNDVMTVRKHLSAFETSDINQIYRQLSKELVAIAAQKNQNSDYAELLELLK